MQTSTVGRMVAALLVGLALFLTGCAGNPKEIDPWEKTNRAFYNFNEGLDRVALKPVSDAYVKVVPQPVRTGVSNVFDNAGNFNVILNDFLQGKWQQGWSDVGRMATNTTIGVAGIFDVASKWGMPQHENDFGLTLGTWGFEQGPYLVLPLVGPSTVRDAPSLGVEILCDPVTWIDTPLWVTIAVYTTETIDARSRAEALVKFRNAAALDPYVFTRNAYLQYRERQLRGEKAPPAADQSIYDEDTDTTQPATTAPATTQKGGGGK